ncbi:hypothetical protein EET67_19785 [Pseudaminobacter arsenicus]|uniref:Uncharacterized protein n=1 Tax=Borborobacter arsenicus TaxID=1851146 RepID=A0A432V1N5_9HYPH|nr:hypothetical protein [Pseudaminobacter arsenicus]RUM96097.1 hypothetical protein EET67_19785 [Pseudaminobacter arsenicus]
MARKSLIVWMKGVLVAVFAAVSLNVADAQTGPCVDHSVLVARLVEKYQERQFAFGLIGNVAVMEIFVAESGTWTIIVTDVTGRSCIVAAGNNWESTMIAGVEA